jgi:hypothetical protein
VLLATRYCPTMVFSCCVVPWTSKVCDEDFERTRRRSKDKSDRRRRSKSNPSKSKSKSKRDRSQKKKEEEEAIQTIEAEDDDDDDDESTEEAKEEERGDEGNGDGSRSGGRPGKKKQMAQKVNNVTSATTKRNSHTKPSRTTSARPERSAPKTTTTKESQVIFREPDEHTIKSDPLPGSLPKSILAESFYSDDSLENGDLTFEVDYSTCTPLFEALELNDWGNVLYFLRAGKFFTVGTLRTAAMDDPETQVRTWVHCQDDQGDVMWRQLPLHAAICLAAPLVVVQRLVELYPDALACPDSFGNLPLNLAAKLHGSGSHLFQVVSIRSQRWLQSRQDSEDEGEDFTTVTTERTGSTPSRSANGPSNDRPMTPLASGSAPRRAREDGWEYRPETPTKAGSGNYMLRALQDSSESEESSQMVYNIHGGVKLRRPNGQY